MASKLLCFWSYIILLCVHFGSGVEGNELRQAAKGIYGSVKSTTVLYTNVSTDVPTVHTPYPESDSENGSILDPPLVLSNLEANGQREQELAILRARPGLYYMAQAGISVHSAYNTDINQQSQSAIWVGNLADGPPQKANIITIGWHVHPKLYGDKNTRFFVGWWIYYEGRLQRGCFDLRCKGFVLHENPYYTPGGRVEKLSVYNATQYYINVKIRKSTAILYANVSTDVPTVHASYSESADENGSIWDQPPFASNLDADGQREQENAILSARPGRYYMAQAGISVHSASDTEINQQSVSAIWVTNIEDGPPQKSNFITVGWHVYPNLYGDKNTRFFVGWWIYYDGRLQRGCFNLLCKGFVLHENPYYTPGGRIEQLSVYNGTQYYINVKIKKDYSTGDWWVYGGPNIPIGYFPQILFTSLAETATNVDFGGAVLFSRGEKGPPMGSGAFASEGELKAASLIQIQLNDKLFDPDDKNFYIRQSLPSWYQMDGLYDKLYFGGHGS